MAAGSVLALVLLTFRPALTLAAGEVPPSPQEPKKLPAYAYVTVLPTKLASKAAHLAVAKAARSAIPAERFESLTVVGQGSLAEARAQAAANNAKLFLHVIVGRPRRIPYTRKVPVRHGRWRRTVTVEEPFCTLRCPVTVRMSIPGGNPWREVKTIKMTSAEAAGAEEELPKDTLDIAKTWAETARLTTRAACEKVLVDYFFRNVKLKAVECEPIEPVRAEDAQTGEENQKPVQSYVKIELLNRSHCRILDATVTVEIYDSRFKRWEPIGAPRGFWRWLRRRIKKRPATRTVQWPIPAAVDPGERAFSEERPVTEKVFQAMKNRKCRLVLHATPAARTLRPPAFPHPLKPTAKAEP